MHFVTFIFHQNVNVHCVNEKKNHADTCLSTTAHWLNLNHYLKQAPQPKLCQYRSIRDDTNTLQQLLVEFTFGVPDFRKNLHTIEDIFIN